MNSPLERIQSGELFVHFLLDEQKKMDNTNLRSKTSP